jgi:hypothetical protein
MQATISGTPSTDAPFVSIHIFELDLILTDTATEHPLDVLDSLEVELNHGLVFPESILGR